MGRVSKSTLYRHIRKYVSPHIRMTWLAQQEDVLTEARQRGNLTVLGDCRSDSPGHCAKYGTYTLMDGHTGKVLDSQVVQVGVTLNFVKFEKRK